MPRDTLHAPPANKSGRAIQVKVDDVLEDGTFTGYGSVFNVLDRGYDIVMPGAFAASLEQHKKMGTTPALLWQHDPCNPIGIWMDVKEDSHGLYVKGKLLTEFESARQAHVLMKHGALSGLSIGYECTVWETDQTQQSVGPMDCYQPQVRKLKEIDLWEVSVVTFPMLPVARIDNVKRERFAMAGGAGSRSLDRDLDAIARAVKTRGTALGR